MTDELRQEIELLKAQVAALTNERLPKVDRASRRRDRRQVLGGFGMFAIALLMAGTLSASALAGSNTVYTDDIVNNHVTNADLGGNSVTGNKVLNDSLTGSDIDESTLALPKIRTTAVSSTGQKVYGSGTVTRQEAGIYNVDYGSAVTACTVQATSGPNFTVGYGNSWDARGNAAASIEGNIVTVYNSIGTTIADGPFFLTVICP